MGNIRWHQLIGPLLKEDCSLQFISYTGYFSVFPMCVYLNTVGYFATYQFVCDYIPRESSKQKYAPVVIYTNIPEIITLLSIKFAEHT